jgi:hypothetical protein
LFLSSQTQWDVLCKLKIKNTSLQIARNGKEFEISIINAQKLAEKLRISAQLVPEPAHKEEERKQFLHTKRLNNSQFQTKNSAWQSATFKFHIFFLCQLPTVTLPTSHFSHTLYTVLPFLTVQVFVPL